MPLNPSKILKPFKTQIKGIVAQGEVGYDNPRENIDPNIVTKVVQAINTKFGTISGLNLYLSSLTAGSVLFVGTDKKITEDNSNFFWDDSNNRLGIGTTTPSSPLHIKDSGANLLQFSRGTGNFYIGQSNNTNDLFFAEGTPAGTIRFYLENGGQVGIGTSSPGLDLEIKGSSPGIRINDSATNSWDIENNAGELTFDRGGTEHARIDNVGLVGIKTTNPITRLEVMSTAAGTNDAIITLSQAAGNLSLNNTVGEIDFYANDASANGTGVTSSIASIMAVAPVGAAGHQRDADLVFNTTLGASSTERLRIMASGMILIPNYSATAGQVNTNSSGGNLFVSGGQLWYKGSSGTETKIANA